MGPISKHARSILKPYEFARIRGLLSHVDSLIETMTGRDRQIRRRYRELREEGMKPEDAYDELGRAFHLSEHTIQRILYSRKKC